MDSFPKVVKTLQGNFYDFFFSLSWVKWDHPPSRLSGALLGAWRVYRITLKQKKKITSNRKESSRNEFSVTSAYLKEHFQMKSNI